MDFKDFEPTGISIDVHRYLTEKGIMVNRRSFFRHAKTGKLRRNVDGLYTISELRNYLSFLGRRPGARTAEPGSEEDLLGKRKLKAEVLKMESAGARAAYELATLQDKYMPRDEIPRELAGRAAILSAGHNHMVYTRAAAWVESVAGDPAKVDELRAIMLPDIDELLLVYADLGSFLDAISGG